MIYTFFKPGQNLSALWVTLSFLSMVLELKNSEMAKLPFVRNLLLHGEGNVEELPDLHIGFSNCLQNTDTKPGTILK